MGWVRHTKTSEWKYGRPVGVMVVLDAHSTEKIARHAGT
jgi:hypothetical protein